MAFGTILGPAVGAAILSVFGWRAIFVLLEIGGLVLFLAVALGLVCGLGAHGNPGRYAPAAVAPARR